MNNCIWKQSMPPKCTALLQCKLHIKCHGAISSDVIQESAADIYLTSTQFVSQGHCGSVFWTVNKTRKHKKIQYYKTIINNNYQQEKTMGRETKQVNWSIGLSILFFISPFFTGTTDPSGTALILSGNFPSWAFKIYCHPFEQNS